MTDPVLHLDGVTSEQARARCPGCSRDVALTTRGLLTAHGPVGARCAGAGLTPAQAAARLDRPTPTKETPGC